MSSDLLPEETESLQPESVACWLRGGEEGLEDGELGSGVGEEPLEDGLGGEEGWSVESLEEGRKEVEEVGGRVAADAGEDDLDRWVVGSEGGSGLEVLRDEAEEVGVDVEVDEREEGVVGELEGTGVGETGEEMVVGSGSLAEGMIAEDGGDVRDELLEVRVVHVEDNLGQERVEGFVEVREGTVLEMDDRG